MASESCNASVNLWVSDTVVYVPVAVAIDGWT